MKNEITDVIVKLAEILGKSGDVIVSEYARWYLCSSFAYIMLGIACIIYTKKTLIGEDIHPILKVLGYAVGAIFIAVNIGDLFAPNGIAIHRLILDIKS